MHLRRCLVLVILLSVALTGCGGGQKKQSTTGTSHTASTQKTTATAPPPKPIATVDATTIGDSRPVPFRVSIYDLRRDGSFLVLDFGIRCLLPSNPGCNTENPFGPGYRPTKEIPGDIGVASGIGLVDPPNLKEYLPVRDSRERAYASLLSPGNNELTDALVHLQWVRYPLPPPGTTALDVVFPDGGPVIPNVPISGGPGPTAGGGVVAAQAAPFDQPPSSTNTAGLILPAENLTLTSGNPAGSDSESPGQAQLTLQSDVLFQFDKSNLTPTARGILHSVAQQIKARARGTVQITGYTDSIGPDAVNIPLSEARARSVVKALTPLTPGITYVAQGKGSADPVAPNTKPDGSDNPAGRALNRRVTIVFAATPVRPAPPAPAAIGTPAGAQTGSITFHGWTGEATWRASAPALYRDGNLMVLTMNIGCVSAGSPNVCDAYGDLTGMPTVPPQSLYFNPPATYTIGAFYLLDPATGTEYIPVHRADRVPLTSNLVYEIPPGNAYQLWSYFPAPPAGTTALTLVSPAGKARLGPLSISDSLPTP